MAQQTQTFRLLGQVGSPDFPDWIARHARKLGVTYDLTDQSPGSITITAKGLGDMLDAFALACSLGPHSVIVETLTFTETATSTADDAISGSS